MHYWNKNKISNGINSYLLWSKFQNHQRKQFPSITIGIAIFHGIKILSSFVLIKRCQQISETPFFICVDPNCAPHTILAVFCTCARVITKAYIAADSSKWGNKINVTIEQSPYACDMNDN